MSHRQSESVAFQQRQDAFDALKVAEAAAKAAHNEWLRVRKSTRHSDTEPQPSDGPDYHEEHAAWERRQQSQHATDPTCACGMPKSQLCHHDRGLYNFHEFGAPRDDRGTDGGTNG